MLKRLNISLNQPKADECEDCFNFQQDLSIHNEESDVFIAYTLHKNKANKANEEYKRDSNKIEIEATRYYSMDLQKVILIPYMPNIKSSYFVSRLVVFNETFATITKSSIFNSYCVLWHEAINGRKAENLTDAIIRIIDIERDVKKNSFLVRQLLCPKQELDSFLSIG